MIASRSCGVSCNLLGEAAARLSRAPSVRGRAIIQTEGTSDITSIRRVVNRDQATSVGPRGFHRGSRAFFGSQSSSISRNPTFLSLPIMQQLRGGGDSERNSLSSTRHNSTLATTESDSTADHRPSWRRAYLAVGSNLGDRYQNIANALSSLEANHAGSIRVLRTSYLRETAPMYVTDQPAFLNGAVEIETTYTPLELLRAMKRAEGDLGRDVGPNSMAVRNGPRPIDLDIIMFDGYEVSNPDGSAADTLGDNEVIPCALVMQTEKLEIPHPRMSEREFVLSPMNDLERATESGRITHPISNKTMNELLHSLFHQNSNSTTSEDEQAYRVLPLPRGRMLQFNRTIIMGILNVTPDSFSDGGKYSSSVELAASQALQLVQDGADIIDIGGESTRPGADEVAVPEELERVIPVIERIRQESDIPISIDTRHAVVAREAIKSGADIVNDVSGGMHDPDMLSSVAEMSVPMIVMHMRGTPKTMQSLTNYSSADNRSKDGIGSEEGGVVPVVATELMQRSNAAEAAGIPRWLQVVDPGIGFAKDIDGNLSLLNGADRLRRSCDNLPFLWGPSRKGFIGKIAGESHPEERDYGTVAACLASIHSNDWGKDDACNMLRVHNVKAVRQAILVYEAIQNAKR